MPGAAGAGRVGQCAQARRGLWPTPRRAPLLRLPYTKQALCERLGKTGCAIAAVTDPGLAKAFVSALAQADPEQYSNMAAALAAKTISDKGTAQSSGGRHGKRRKQV